MTAIDTVRTLKVDIWRGGEDGHYRSYTVPHETSQTILDVVTYVQRKLDPTLSYRFACRVGMCGSCAMTVNGRPRWTCRTHVDRVAEDGGIRIEPLRNFPLVKDLAVDMTVFFDKWRDAKGRFVPSEPDLRCHRMHRLRHLLRRLRCCLVESGLSGPRRPEPRVDVGQ